MTRQSVTFSNIRSIGYQNCVLEVEFNMSFYDGEPLDDESKELLRISLENSMRLAKQMAKKKLTPNKYKK